MDVICVSPLQENTYQYTYFVLTQETPNLRGVLHAVTLFDLNQKNNSFTDDVSTKEENLLKRTIDHKSNFTQGILHPSLLLFIADTFKNINFLQYFYQFSQWMRYALFQINNRLFAQETLYPSFISKKKLALFIANFF